MDKQPMERRDFLRKMGSLFLGIVSIPLIQLFREKKDIAVKSVSTKEAMHYTSGDNLAG